MFLSNVWWPTFRQFESLHPEYEIQDYRDGYRYLDFAYIQPYFRIAIEIDGLGPHWKNITKWQFADQWHRQNQLIIDGWYVIRFTYDDVSDRPRLCQQGIQQLMGRWLISAASIDKLTVLEREIIRVVVRSSRAVVPRDVCFLLQISPDYAQKLLRMLVHKQWLQPASGTIRVRSYELHPSRSDIKL
jgi:very-short-patch-repair endonuclease